MSKNVIFIDTNQWGPWAWSLFHYISLHFNENIDKKSYYDFYKLFGELLPCLYCKKHYNDIFDLTIDNIKKEYLIHWTYEIHNKVREELEQECSSFKRENLYEKYYNINPNVMFHYMDLIINLIPKNLSISELNKYIYFLKLFIILNPNEYSSENLENICNVKDLKTFYYQILK